MAAAQISRILSSRAAEDWLICDSEMSLASQQLWQLTEGLAAEFIQFSQKPKVLLMESDPVKFLAGFLSSVIAGCPVFLGNPAWQFIELQQVFEEVQPDLILGSGLNCLTINRQYDRDFLVRKIGDRYPHLSDRTFQSFPFSQTQSLIMIPTGGSSGNIRFAVHTWETLSNSVKGLSDYLEQKVIHSYCILPLYHVSGLMQFMRSFLTQGKLVILPFKQLDFTLNPSEFFISLVPTQLQRLLETQAEWLSQFRTVFLGGAPAWESLLTAAQIAEIPLALTYGMTETASQIVTLKPRDFLNNNRSCGQVLPHAKITLSHQAGEVGKANRQGIITLESQSLMLGYYSANFQPHEPIRRFESDDLGYWDEQGYLYIIGRNSQKIITGGENVFPAEVEAAILATQQVQDVCIIGLLDPEWGEVVTAVYVPLVSGVEPAAIKSAIASRLAAYKHPKVWLAVDSLPRNAQGKINRAQLLSMALKQHQLGSSKF